MKHYWTKKERSYKKGRALHKSLEALSMSGKHWSYQLDSPEYKEFSEHSAKEFRKGIPCMYSYVNLYKVDPWYTEDKHAQVQDNKMAFAHEEAAMDSRVEEAFRQQAESNYQEVANLLEKAIRLFHEANDIYSLLGEDVNLEDAVLATLKEVAESEVLPYPSVLPRKKVSKATMMPAISQSSVPAVPTSSVLSHKGGNSYSARLRRAIASQIAVPSKMIAVIQGYYINTRILVGSLKEIALQVEKKVDVISKEGYLNLSVLKYTEDLQNHINRYGYTYEAARECRLTIDLREI